MGQSLTDKGVGAAGEQERVVLLMVRKYLADARDRRVTGKLTFEVDLHEGGVQGKWVSSRFKEY